MTDDTGIVTVEETVGFDPENITRYLTSLRGVPYLEVKWRTAWMESTWQNYQIVTDPIEITDQRAVMQVTVRLIDGENNIVRSADGIGSETPRDFPDYIEKAQTKALGRALAVLGFGTQFAVELGGEAAANRPVDAPAQRPAPGNPIRATMPNGNTVQTPPVPRLPNGQRQIGPGHSTNRPMEIRDPTAPASDKQVNFIKGLAKRVWGDEADEQVYATAGEMGFDLDFPTKQNASDLIERLNGYIAAMEENNG